MRFRSVLAWVPVAALFVACGSDDSEGDSGSKTTCAAGATQACTCNGSDTGVQVCAPDGKSWGTCDCGSSGAGGTGGTSGDASSGGSGGGIGGSSGGGAGGNGGAAGLADGGAGAPPTDSGADADYTPGPDDDPCPVDTQGKPNLDINCSTSCRPRDAICDLLECNTASDPLQVLVTQLQQLQGGGGESFVIRLPANPKGPCVGCNLPPSPSNMQVHASYTFRQETGFGYPIRVDVGLPWRAGYPGGVSTLEPLLCYKQLHGECAWTNTFPTGFSFYTVDPNAPARNATIRIAVKNCDGL